MLLERSSGGRAVSDLQLPDACHSAGSETRTAPSSLRRQRCRHAAQWHSSSPASLYN